MTFTEAELRGMLYCAGEELRARAAGKRPGPQPWLRKLVRRLELEVAVSATRHQTEADQPSSEHDSWIGSRLAAQMLGWDARRVQRRATDLDGRKVGSRWIFRENAVKDYLEALTDA